MKKAAFQDFLVTIMFERNDYGSRDALVNAIETASAIPEKEWRKRKDAFNEIGENAPLSDAYGFCLTHESVPSAIQGLGDAYELAADRDHSDSTPGVSTTIGEVQQ